MTDATPEQSAAERTFVHASVMLEETLEALSPRSGGVYADATLGGGGHAEAILERSAPDGRVVGIDRDPDALSAARQRLARFGDRATFVHGDFAQLSSILDEVGTPRIDGFVADLGVSSPQLDREERGFSFRFDGPLDMRMDTSQGPTAEDYIASLTETELADVIYQLGEERKSRPIARSIKRAEDEGALRTTQQLRRAVIRAVGPRRRGGIDPATRTFQALRIAVNDELGQLDALLRQTPDVLVDDGVAVLISFHSLEDRKVKRCFRGVDTLTPMSKRPLIAAEAERETNPRARSAKLRAARRVSRAEEEA